MKSEESPEAGKPLDSNIAVDDDEYTRRRRKRAVLDAYEDVWATEKRAEELVHFGEISEHQAKRSVFLAAREFLRHSRHLVNDYDDTEKLNKEVLLGSIDIPKPTPEKQGYPAIRPDIELVDTHGNDKATVIIFPEEKVVEFFGTRSVWSSEPTISFVWNVSGVKSDEIRKSSIPFPKHIALTAVEHAWDVLKESDLTLDGSSGRDGVFEHDYSHLIENGTGDTP